MAEPTYIDQGATFDASRVYRYRLWRAWSPGPRVAFLLLNPSTATESVLDPTLRRCLRYALDWNFNGFEVGNIFGLRSTDPRALKGCADPVGPGNDAALVDIAQRCPLLVAGWGSHGTYLGRDLEVQDLVLPHRALHALRITKGGAPQHPLYLPSDLVPQVYLPQLVERPYLPSPGYLAADHVPGLEVAARAQHLAQFEEPAGAPRGDERPQEKP